MILALPAGLGGVVVTLSSSNPAAAVVPATVTVPTGANSFAFPIVTFSVASATEATITASYAGGVTSLTLQVLAGAAGGQLVLFPNPVPGGLLALGQLTLPQPVGPGGRVVALVSSHVAAAVVPVSVSVAPGASTVTFPIITFPVRTATPVVITAIGLGNPVTATLQVLP